VASPLPSPSAPSALERALTDLGPQVRRGALPSLPVPRLASGVPALDALTGGGLPRGRVSEIAGPDSAGRTALGLALLAATTRSGALAAWIDPDDAFDPASAAAAGVELARVLWVRAPGLRAALRAAERVLEAQGFPLVLLDLPPRAGEACEPARARRGRALDGATWPRLARAAAAADAALVVLAPARHGGVWTELALELAPGAPRFTGTPALLEERALYAALARGRAGAVPGRSATLRLRAADAAA